MSRSLTWFKCFATSLIGFNIPFQSTIPRYAKQPPIRGPAGEFPVGRSAESGSCVGIRSYVFLRAVYFAWLCQKHYTIERDFFKMNHFGVPLVSEAKISPFKCPTCNEYILWYGPRHRRS